MTYPHTTDFLSLNIIFLFLGWSAFRSTSDHTLSTLSLVFASVAYGRGVRNEKPLHGNNVGVVGNMNRHVRRTAARRRLESWDVNLMNGYWTGLHPAMGS